MHDLHEGAVGDAKTSRSMPEFRGTHKLDAAGNPVELTGFDRAAGFSWYGLTMEVR